MSEFQTNSLTEFVEKGKLVIFNKKKNCCTILKLPRSVQNRLYLRLIGRSPVMANQIKNS